MGLTCKQATKEGDDRNLCVAGSCPCPLIGASTAAGLLLMADPDRAQYQRDDANGSLRQQALEIIGLQKKLILCSMHQYKMTLDSVQIQP